MLPFRGIRPTVDRSAFIAPGAWLIGDVTLARGSSIWFNAVLRADLAPIRIGADSNIQDNCVLHVDHDGPCIVGAGVIVGHGVVLHACTIGDGALIGMGSTILSEAVIGDGALIAAGSLVKERTVVPPGTLFAGNPAEYVKELGPGMRARIKRGAAVYADLVAGLRESLEDP
jgi:carbonic anhydrase/acetyltransferase-like protein (isoleucine patch superfamily)